MKFSGLGGCFISREIRPAAQALAEVKILGISGSSRKRSFNTALLESTKEFLPDGASLEIFDISGFPIYNQDWDADPPEKVVEFKQKVRAADAILIATPEHNYSVSALLKNAIEWGNRPDDDNSWDGKPAAIMSASSALRGGARAQLHLRQIMVDLNMYPINQPQVYVARASQAFDSEMRLTDEQVRKNLRSLVEALVNWAIRLRE